jgi:Fe2+ transport system protein FeoA
MITLGHPAGSVGLAAIFLARRVNNRLRMASQQRNDWIAAGCDRKFDQMQANQGVGGTLGSGPAMPLALASIGQEVELKVVRAGRRLQHRLAEIGLSPGARFKIVNKNHPGPFIITVKGVRLMLGHGMVRCMLVCPVP